MSLGRLKGAFEGYILDLNESAGASGKLRDTIEFLTTNMNTILNTVLQLVEVFNGNAWTSVAGTSGGVTFNDATEIGVAMVLTLG